MIATVDLIAAIRTNLDIPDDNDFFDDLGDIVPAINSALVWIVNVVDAAKSEKKKVSEALRYLQEARVYRTSEDSRITLEEDVWFIEAVVPFSSTGQLDAEPPDMEDDKQSYRRMDLYHKDSNYWSKRLTIEEWHKNKYNRFRPGNVVQCAPSSPEEAKDTMFAYLDPYDYLESGGLPKIEIRPKLDKKISTIFVVRVPAKIQQDESGNYNDIEFPMSMFEMIKNKALSFLSVSQGDQINLFAATRSDISLLAQSIT